MNQMSRLSRRDPFRQHAPGGPVFAHAGWRWAREAVLSAVAQGGPVALLGQPGSGKSLLLQDLAEQLRLDGRDVRLVERGDALAGVPPGEVVLVDEAGSLSDEGLQELIAAGVPALLAGLPGFLHRLEGLDCPAVALDPMRPEEVAQFVAVALAGAGRPDDLFAADAVAVLAARSRGLLRLVNALGRAALFLAEMEGVSQVTARHVEEADAMRRGLGEEDAPDVNGGMVAPAEVRPAAVAPPVPATRGTRPAGAGSAEGSERPAPEAEGPAPERAPAAGIPEQAPTPTRPEPAPEQAIAERGPAAAEPQPDRAANLRRSAAIIREADSAPAPAAPATVSRMATAERGQTSKRPDRPPVVWESKRAPLGVVPEPSVAVRPLATASAEEQAPPVVEPSVAAPERPPAIAGATEQAPPGVERSVAAPERPRSAATGQAPAVVMAESAIVAPERPLGAAVREPAPAAEPTEQVSEMAVPDRAVPMAVARRSPGFRGGVLAASVALLLGGLGGWFLMAQLQPLIVRTPVGAGAPVTTAPPAVETPAAADAASPAEPESPPDIASPPELPAPPRQAPVPEGRPARAGVPIEGGAAYRGAVFNETIGIGGRLSLVIRPAGPGGAVRVRFDASNGLVGAGELTGHLSPDGTLSAAGTLMMGRNPFDCDLAATVTAERVTGAASFTRVGSEARGRAPTQSRFNLSRT